MKSSPEIQATLWINARMSSIERQIRHLGIAEAAKEEMREISEDRSSREGTSMITAAALEAQMRKLWSDPK